MKVQVAVRVFRDGREVCNTRIAAGKAIYEGRKMAMWERQGRRCCLYRHIRSCPGRLEWNEATFDHEVPRGHGGGSRDDRIVLPDGKWQNGAAHWRCNSLKGSRRIGYNEGKYAVSGFIRG
jgi:hypothetical protein